MTQLTDKVGAMDVPSMAFGFDINNYADESELMYMLSMSDIADDENAEETLITKPLPPGTWRFLFTTKTATEEDARKVVRSSEWHFPEKHARYVDYKFPFDRENKQRWGEGFGSAIESLHSLLRSKGLDENKNYALIEKLK